MGYFYGFFGHPGLLLATFGAILSSVSRIEGFMKTHVLLQENHAFGGFAGSWLMTFWYSVLWSIPLECFLLESEEFVVSQGPPRGPIGSPVGTFRH